MDVLHGIGGVLYYAFHTVMLNLFPKRSVGFSYLNLFLCQKNWLICFSNKTSNFYFSAKFQLS